MGGAIIGAERGYPLTFKRWGIRGEVVKRYRWHIIRMKENVYTFYVKFLFLPGNQNAWGMYHFFFAFFLAPIVLPKLQNRGTALDCILTILSVYLI